MNLYEYAGNNFYDEIDPSGFYLTANDPVTTALDHWLFGGAISRFAQDLGAQNGGCPKDRNEAADGFDAVTSVALLFLPGGEEVEGAQLAEEGAADAGRLADETLVVRGGTNTPDRFTNGTGVVTDENGNIWNASVQSSAGKTVSELSGSLRNKQIGVTTVGDVRGAGGDVVASPTANNLFHATLGGISAEAASELFTPTILNPNL